MTAHKVSAHEFSAIGRSVAAILGNQNPEKGHRRCHGRTRPTGVWPWREALAGRAVTEKSTKVFYGICHRCMAVT
jgi:hypothetical protein